MEKVPVFIKSADGHRVCFLFVFIYISHFLTPYLRHQYPPEEYVGRSEAVFVDSASLTNLLSGVPLGSLDLVSWLIGSVLPKS